MILLVIMTYGSGTVVASFVSFMAFQSFGIGSIGDEMIIGNLILGFSTGVVVEMAVRVPCQIKESE